MQYIIIFITLVCAIFGAAELLESAYRELIERLADRRGKKCRK